MKTKLRVVADGRLIRFFMTAVQVSDCPGATALLGSLPIGRLVTGNRGVDADSFREMLKDKGIKPYISGRKFRDRPIKHDSAATIAAAGSRSSSVC